MSTSETLKLACGYTATIATDECPSNPFEDFDCEPPMAVYYGSHYGHPARKGTAVNLTDLFDLVPDDAFSFPHKRESIVKAFGRTLEELHSELENRGIETPADANPEDWKDVLWEMIPAEPGRYDREDDYFDAMEILAGLANVPCFRGTSRGHSQGDYAEVFLAALPAWIQETGIAAENIPASLKCSFDLYTAWAWGDVYGVSEIIRPDGTEIEDGSCWGFYGSHHEASGLMEHCNSAVTWDRSRRLEEIRKSRAFKRAEKAAAFEAACRDIATV